MKKIAIFTLHGFLGRPADWNFLKSDRYELVAVDYMNIRGLTPDSSLERWGDNFNIWAEKNYPKHEKHLIGYSQGGRLAQQAVTQKSVKWKSVVFISSNYGLEDEDQKKHRISEDQRWAQKFLTYDFSTVLREWNAQAVFKGTSNEPTRIQKDYEIELLAKCFTAWSLGRQKYLFHDLLNLQIPQLWLAGEFDSKYIELFEKLKGKSERIKVLTVKNASHRAIFDQPELVKQEILRLLD